MPLDRRAALQRLGTAFALPAAFAAPGLIGRATAEPAAPAPAQAPGFYRFKIGGFVVTTVNDGYFDFPVDKLITNASLAEVQAILQDSFLSPTIYHNPFTLTLVETPRGIVMFDCGTGGQMGPHTGKLPQNLRAAGIDPSRITTIVFSHFHTDHITGLLSADGEAVFPQAELIVPEPEWKFWSDRGNETRSPPFQRSNFANVAKRFGPYQNRVRQVAQDTEVVPGIHSFAAPGHTPGHTLYRISDGGEQMIFIADTTHRPELFVRHPELHAIIDFDPDQAEATRRKVLDMLATDRIRISGYHYPFPANGYILRDGASYRFVPANWTSEI